MQTKKLKFVDHVGDDADQNGNCGDGHGEGG